MCKCDSEIERIAREIKDAESGKIIVASDDATQAGMIEWMWEEIARIAENCDCDE